MKVLASILVVVTLVYVADKVLLICDKHFLKRKWDRNRERRILNRVR